MHRLDPLPAPRRAGPVHRPGSVQRGRGIPTILALATIALGLGSSIGCPGETDPVLREPTILIDGAAFRRMAARVARLEGTPLARQATSLLRTLGDCDAVWGRARPEDDPARLLQTLGCARDASGDGEGLARARRKRGDADLFVQWPLGADGRLALHGRLEPDDGLEIAGRLDPPSAPGPWALLLPDDEAPAPAALSAPDALLHARLRPADGLRLSRLLPAGGQADRLFALKSRLLEGALLAGTWELAFMPPEADGEVPWAVGALHHRHPAPIRSALDEALAQLERTWPIRRSPRRFVAADGTTWSGGCYQDLPLLPELAPCWLVTPRAILVGYRAEAIQAALARPPGSGQAATKTPESTSEGGGGRIEIDLERLGRLEPRPDAEHAATPPRTRVGDLWSRLELRLAPAADGAASFVARLEARS